MDELPYDARGYLEGLVGTRIPTPERGQANRIVRIVGERVLVETSHSRQRGREGAWIDIAWVQDALDQLRANGDVALEGKGAGPRQYRSSFIGGLLETIPGVEVGGTPRRARLAISSSWVLRPGESIRRAELHQRFGGSARGGMAPSRSTPNVFLFTDPVGHRHGYYDGWAGEHFHYTGMGQRGDQLFQAGNRAVLEHEGASRALRLFRGAGGVIIYLGEFRLDPDAPWYRTDAPETDSARLRQVIVFRLLPLGHAVREDRDRLQPPTGLSPQQLDRATSSSPDGQVVHVAVEEQHTEEAVVNPRQESYSARRDEHTLMLRYKAFVEAEGASLVRLQIVPPGEAKPLFCDLYDPDRNHLIEAKATGTREQIRMAIGQLVDYARLVDGAPKLAVLVPTRPRPDLETLLRSQGIAAIWLEDDRFADNAEGRFA